MVELEFTLCKNGLAYKMEVLFTPTNEAEMVNKYIFKFDNFCMVVVPK